MRRQSKFISLLAIIIIVALILSVPIYAYALGSGNVGANRISDKYDHLSASDESKIVKAVKDAEEELINVRFLVAVFDYDKAIPSGKDIVASFGFDHNTDNIVLLVIKYNMDTVEVGDYRDRINKHYYEMFTYGTPHRDISDYEADEILDCKDVYDNLKGGKFAEGAVAFIKQSVKVIKNDGSSDGNDSLTWIIVCVGGGFIIVLIIIAIITYKKMPDVDVAIPAKSKSNKKGSSGASRVSGYGSSAGGSGGFGGSTGGSRGGR